MNKIILYIIYIMGDLDNEVSEYIINFTNDHRHLPNWNNLTDDQRNEVNGIWTGFNKGEHTMQELEDAIPLDRQPAESQSSRYSPETTSTIRTSTRSG